MHVCAYLPYVRGMLNIKKKIIRNSQKYINIITQY